jgi:phage terminase large subunit GpA-like protein
MGEEKFSKRGIIPEGTVAATIGADSQSDGFYWLLACWGRKMELWLPFTDRIVGDMRDEDVWKELAEVLATRWLDKDGNVYRPMMSALDVQGDYYPECLEFVRAHGYKCRLRAVRGYAPAKGLGAGRTFGILRNIHPDKTTNVGIQNVDVDIAKSQLADMLSRKDPGPGFVHLPCGPNGEDKGGWTVEAIAELTSEYRRQANLRGYTITRWFKRSGRPNHRLDCLVYALAALRMSRLKIDTCELQRIEARNADKPEKQQTGNPNASPFGARPMKILPAPADWPGFASNPPTTSKFGRFPGSGVW